MELDSSNEAIFIGGYTSDDLYGGINKGIDDAFVMRVRIHDLAVVWCTLMGSAGCVHALHSVGVMFCLFF